MGASEFSGAKDCQPAAASRHVAGPARGDWSPFEPKQTLSAPPQYGGPKSYWAALTGIIRCS
jgi:hypothetical protein